MYPLKIASICAATTMIPWIALAQQDNTSHPSQLRVTPTNATLPGAMPPATQSSTAAPNAVPGGAAPDATIPALPSAPERATISSNAVSVESGRLLADGIQWLETKKEYEIAIKTFDEAIRLKHDNAYAFYKRGQAWYGKGLLPEGDPDCFERAADDFAVAILLNPDYVDAYVARGDAYRRLRRYALAIDDYNEAIRRDANCAAAYCGRNQARLCLTRLQAAAAQERKKCRKAKPECGNGQASTRTR